MSARAIGGQCPPYRAKQPGSNDSRTIRVSAPPRHNGMVDLARAATARSAQYRAKRRGRVGAAEPMPQPLRYQAYLAQNRGRAEFTPRQLRRFQRVDNRALARTGAA